MGGFRFIVDMSADEHAPCSTVVARAFLRRFTVASWMCFGLVACDHGTARPVLGEISSIELQPFVGAIRSRVLDTYTTTRVAHEVNALRGENWREFRGKVGACSVVIKMLSGNAEVAKYYVTLEPLQLIELGFQITLRLCSRQPRLCGTCAGSCCFVDPSRRRLP